jgi:transposase
MSTAVSPAGRFVALDVHKSYLVVAAVDAAQQIVLHPKRLLLAEFSAWSQHHLRASDQVVLEATTSTWDWYDQLVPLVAAVTVANPLQVQLIAATRVKTDNRDTLVLARLLAAGLVPAVWVPPRPVRELRALVAQRARLIRQRTQVRNRLHAILLAHHYVPPEGDPFALAQRTWWLSLALNASERLQVRQDFALLTSLTPLIAELDAALVSVSQQAPWAEQVPYVLQLPGFKVHNALVLLAAIGEIGRFPTPKQLVGYSGLGASVHRSGQVAYTGRITKQGRRELRRVLVEAAWSAVDCHPYWKAQFARLQGRLGANKAIVAIARKLLVAIWHVLTRQEADAHAEVALVARKLLRRAWELKAVGRGGQSAGAWVRQELERLGIGRELTGVVIGQIVHRLPPPPAVGALA